MQDGSPATAIAQWPRRDCWCSIGRRISSTLQGEHRGYVLNVFVEPEYRGRGLARALMELCVTEARSRGIRVVALHASDAGRPLYEKLGFYAANEMLFVTPEED